MNRRGFLGVLAGATTAIVVPELLLPKRTFFLPPAGGWGNPIPFREPSPVLFQMLRELEEMSERLSQGWTDPSGVFGRLPEIPPVPGYRVEWIPSRLHTEDLPGVVLEETNGGTWRRLRLV